MIEKVIIGFFVVVLFLVGGVTFTVVAQKEQFTCVSESGVIDRSEEPNQECCPMLKTLEIYSKDGRLMKDKVACMSCGNNRCEGPENAKNCPFDCDPLY